MKKKMVLAGLLGSIVLLTASCSASSPFFEEAKDALAEGGSTSSRTSHYATSTYDGGYTGYGNDGMADAAPPPGDYSAAAPEPENNPLAQEYSEETNDTELTAVSQGRKVIKNASFYMETTDFNKTMADVLKEVEVTGSYLEASNTSGLVETGDANAWMRIRVPSDRYEGLKANLRTLGNVTSSSEGGNDVTTEYFDRDTRVTVLKTQESRLLELLAKAGTVEDMLKIENELTRIRTEIEQLTTELRRFDDLVSYATISLEIRQTSTVTPLKDPDNQSFFEQMGETTMNSLNAVVQVLKTLVIVLIWILPYLIVTLAVVLLVRWSLRRHKKKAGTGKKQDLPNPSGWPSSIPNVPTGGIDPPSSPSTPPAGDSAAPSDEKES